MIEIIGKNGSGKSYLANKLYMLGFQRNVGYTTRPMRAREIDGIDYYFITEEKFEEYINNNDFIEYKTRNGFYYGIKKDNISENTILVSGDAKKITDATGYDILKIYIDCDLTIRYLRVLNRNDLTMNIFNRFHTENFSYLYDFDAIFINNCLNDNTAFEKTIEIAKNSDFAYKNLKSNRKFIEEKVNNFDISQISDNNKLLLLLKYEEYLLRKLFLENKDLTNEYVIREYYNNLFEFMDSNKIKYIIKDSELYADIEEVKYKFDYKIRKKAKK